MLSGHLISDLTVSFYSLLVFCIARDSFMLCNKVSYCLYSNRLMIATWTIFRIMSVFLKRSIFFQCGAPAAINTNISPH